MSIYRDSLYYDNSTNTLVANANFTTTGTYNALKYTAVSTAAGTQSIPDDTNTAVSFTSDTLTNWSTRSDNTKFVAPVAGTYLVSVQCGYATPPGTAGTNKMLVFKNTTLIGEQSFPYETAINIFNWSGLVSMNGTTDYITVMLYQNSGGAVNAGGANGDGGNFNKVTIDRIHS
jgi:hypothetical protein